MAEARDLAQENARLTEENERLRKLLEFNSREAAHWKSNHAQRVEAARVLIERPDLPLERVDAYRKYLAALGRAVQLEDSLAEERKKHGPERLAGVDYELLRFQLTLEEFAISMWKRFYQIDSPKFEPADTPSGLLAQISNMVSGLTRVEDEPSGWLCVFPSVFSSLDENGKEVHTHGGGFIQIYPHEPHVESEAWSKAREIHPLYKQRKTR